jgi:uncharacterized protein YqhQ
MEGVLMRGRNAIAVALRHPDGRIVTRHRDAGLRRPHRAGSASGRSCAASSSCTRPSSIGTRWLVRSANVQAEEDDVELGKGTIAITAAHHLRRSRSPVQPAAAVHLERGHVRREPGLGTAGGRGLDPGLPVPRLPHVRARAQPDIYRVFQYHGAEHMTIHALEAGDPLTVAEVRKYPTAHHRCGTEFLVILVLLSIFAFSLVGKQRRS